MAIKLFPWIQNGAGHHLEFLKSKFEVTNVLHIIQGLYIPNMKRISWTVQAWWQFLEFAEVAHWGVRNSLLDLGYPWADLREILSIL